MSAAACGAASQDARNARNTLKALYLTPNEAARHGLSLSHDGVRRDAYQLLSHADIGFTRLTQIWPQLAEIDEQTAEAVETEARYAVYLARQEADFLAIRREEGRLIPVGLDFSMVPGLSNELRQKLRERRPASVADAQRIDGMTPAAMALIIAHVRLAERDAA